LEAGEFDPMTKRTNSFNPAQLELLDQSIQDLKKFNDRVDFTKDFKAPSKPKLNLPPIAARYKVLGKELGICPYEIMEIMECNITTEDQTVIALLKKFIAAVKLTGTVDVQPVRNRINQHRHNHSEDVRHWQQQCESVAAEKQRYIKEQQNIEKAVFQHWRSMMIDLQATLQKGNQLGTLGDLDHCMVLALKKVGAKSKYCEIIDGEVTLHYDEVIHLKYQQIITALKVYNEKREDLAQKNYEKRIKALTKKQIIDLVMSGDHLKDPDYEKYRHTFSIVYYNKVGHHLDQKRQKHWRREYDPYNQYGRYEHYSWSKGTGYGLGSGWEEDDLF
jgi:hypothetical protein